MAASSDSVAKGGDGTPNRAHPWKYAGVAARGFLAE